MSKTIYDIYLLMLHDHATVESVIKRNTIYDIVFSIEYIGKSI